MATDDDQDDDDDDDDTTTTHIQHDSYTGNKYTFVDLIWVPRTHLLHKLVLYPLILRIRSNTRGNNYNRIPNRV